MESKEVYELIATRVPPGDLLQLVDEKTIYPSLT